MERIVSLGRAEAINAIKDTSFVMYKHGVWNQYNKVPTVNAIECINKSGYGADIYREGEQYYVSCPCDSDMW